ncbi:hypothetical protein N665_2183s0005 [Sinapis alba]|nr:hypothetical protein N665_2183s0005 [Sinapis alba]
MNEARTIAMTFEDEIFRGAVDKTDYLRRISLKMVTMETKWQHAAGSSSSSLSITEASKKRPLNPGHFMDNIDSKPSLTRAEAAVNTYDLTTQLPSDSRQNNANTAVQYMTGPSLPSGERPTMTTYDWRTQLKPDSREKTVNKITETLQKHLPQFSPEDVRRTAVKFEEKIFSRAVNQTGYHQSVSMKMLTTETKYKTGAGSSTILRIPDANKSLPLNPDLCSSKEAMGQGEAAMDWKTQFPSGSRENIVNKMMETLRKHLPYSGEEGMNELRKIASRFEDRIFRDAVNQTDYFRKISTKMLTMETKRQNGAASSSSSSLPYPGAYNSLPLNPGYHQMKMEGSVKAEPAENIGDWRTCLPPDSRNKNANKIKGTLTKHVPNCGKEGNKELEKIATSLEELIFNTAIDQVDYLHKTSFKITP